MANEELLFDPNIFLPDDLSDASYVQTDVQSIPIDSVNDDGSISFEGDYVNEFDTDMYINSDSDTVDAFELSVPTTLTILSQTIRTAPDGRQVVDVTIEVEDVVGATNYQVRVTK